MRHPAMLFVVLSSALAVAGGVAGWMDILRPVADAQATRRGAAPIRAVWLSPIPPSPPLSEAASRRRLNPDEVGVQSATVRVLDPEPIEPEIVAAINELRRSRGLRALAVSKPLARAGDAHARALGVAGAFTHDWPASREGFGRWIVRYYGARSTRFWTAGENLLWAEESLTPDQAVTMWMNSPRHRAILLRPAWREVGVGAAFAVGAGGYYGGRSVYIVAAEFGSRPAR